MRLKSPKKCYWCGKYKFSTELRGTMGIVRARKYVTSCDKCQNEYNEWHDKLSNTELLADENLFKKFKQYKKEKK